MRDWLWIPGAILVLLAVSGLVFKAGRWIENLKNDREDFAKGIKANQKSISEIAQEIRTDIKKIFLRLPPPSVAESQSPARLTDFGKQVSHTIGAKTWAESLAPSLKDKIVGLENHQVEMFCRKYVRDGFPDDNDRISLGMYEHAISREPVLAVLRIVLRDELLKHQLQSSTDEET